MKQISLVKVTFDQRNENSVMLTIMSVYTHLHDSKLPSLAKTAIFQKKMVDLLHEKLQKSLRKMYNTFVMKTMKFKEEIVSVENWIEAFNHVGSMIVRNDSKAAFWTQLNPNSSNSQIDRPKGTMIGKRIRNQEVVGKITITNRTLGIITHIKTRII